MKNILKYITILTDPTKKKGRITSWIILIGSVLILCGTSFYLAEKSALVHNNNHDQLIDSYMFESPETFKEALFPSAHTFFIKWPLFALSAALGNSSSVYIALTIVTYIVTVLGFLLVTFFLSKRNLLLTALAALLLSSTLLLVPAQPYNATLLPVNMAMITTRNIEFLILFIYIYLIIGLRKINSPKFYMSIVTLGVLGATDKYYPMIVLIGAVLYLLYMTAITQKRPSMKSYLPLISAAGGYALANIILYGINYIHLTNVPSPAVTAPFALVSSVWEMLEAFAGAIQGAAVNFGAGFFGRSVGISLAPYIVNCAIFVAAIVSLYLLYRKQNFTNTLQNTTEWNYVLWLTLTFVGAVVIFIASDHGYTYDARYLTGALFAGIAAIIYILSIQYTPTMRIWITVTILGLVVMTPLTLLVARENLARTIDANQKELGVRTDQAAAIIAKENVDIFVGDYWFVTPTKLKSNKQVTIVPMSTEVCDTPNNFLTSKKWYQPSAEVNKTAYYILRDADPNSETFNHGCTLDYLNQKYGTPEREYIIRGTQEKPIDIVRVYPYDVRTRF